MSDDLIARLQSHSRAFEGLMSLIPAKYYYGEDHDDQWKRKKQTKEEKRAAKRAKLDPDSYRSALDVHKETERKRKRELEDDSDAVSDLDRPREQPREGMKPPKEAHKKQKRENAPSETTLDRTEKEDNDDDDEARRRAKVEKKKAKRDRQKAKKARSREKKEAKRTNKQLQQEDSSLPGQSQAPPASSLKRTAVSTRDIPEQKSGIAVDTKEPDQEVEEHESDQDQIEDLDLDGIANEDNHKTHNHHDQSDDPESLSDLTRSPSPVHETPALDESSAPSSASSSSSVNPPSEPDVTKSPELAAQHNSVPETPPPKPDSAAPESTPPNNKPSKLLPMNQELLKQRLEEKIAALRAQRGADGLDGKPARNRAELIEARRRKEELRRAAKKKQRNKEKEHDAEAEAARLRGGSDSPLWTSPGVFGPAPRSPLQDNSTNNFSFAKLKFDDGTQVDASLSGAVVDPKKHKGPQDPKTALEAAENKASRLNGLDAAKRADIQEKDRWLNARKRVEGEKVRDDVSLLKKALKRKTKAKEKSEKEWKGRTDGVQKGIEARQAKRAENIAKRKEGKGGKKNKKGGAKGAGGSGSGSGSAAPKPRRRPGFEGSFKTGKRNML